jgi:hypothetical protein
MQDATEGILEGGRNAQGGPRQQPDPAQAAQTFADRTGTVSSPDGDDVDGSRPEDSDSAEHKWDKTTREVGFVHEKDDDGESAEASPEESVSNSVESAKEGSGPIAGDGTDEDAIAGEVETEEGDKALDIDDEQSRNGAQSDEAMPSEEDGAGVADSTDVHRCEFPTGDGPCQNVVDAPEERCHIEAHHNEDEIAAAQAQADQAETIEEYPDADTVLETMTEDEPADEEAAADGGDPDGE